MSQSRAGRAARLGSITLELSLPTDYASNSLRFWDGVVPSAGGIAAIRIAAGTAISFVPSIVTSRP
jgi:hypothetical protein